MNRFYKPLTTITFEHSFYTSNGGICPDFDVTPTNETMARIRSHRLLWGTKNRKAPNQYELIAESYGASLLLAEPLIELPTNTSFCFGLELKNPDFVNFTTLPARTANQVYLVRNKLNLAALTIEAITLVGSLYQLDGLVDSLVRIYMPDGVSYFDVDRTLNGGSYSALINFSGMPEGVYKITSSLGPQFVFMSQELAARRVFGVLYLQKGDGNQIRLAHTASFAARSAQWKYFIVLRGDHGDWEYSIDYDEIAPAGNDFIPYLDTAWTPEDLGTLVNATLSPPDTVIGFISGPSIGYSDVVRSSIALTRTLPLGSPVVVVSNLPNPPLGSASASVVVTVDPPL